MNELTYTNPVWNGYFADPFVLKHEGEYWAYGTGAAVEGRQFPVLRSLDLVHWEAAGGALEPLRNPDRTQYWAPEVAFRDGTFYLYYSAAHGKGPQGHRLRVATSDRPQGPFKDSGAELFPHEGFTIDAHPFCDPQDGQWYLFFAKDFHDGRVGTGLAVAPLCDDMMTLRAAAQPAIRASADWQIYARDRVMEGRTWEAWHTVEGPFVLFHEGLYYCLYSGGAWETPDYGVGYGIARHPLGPWRDEWHSEGPSVLRRVPDKVLGPGHNSVVIGPDGHTHFVVYHAWDVQKTARRMCIDPLIWTADGPRCAGPSHTRQTIQL